MNLLNINVLASEVNKVEIINYPGFSWTNFLTTLLATVIGAAVAYCFSKRLSENDKDYKRKEVILNYKIKTYFNLYNLSIAYLCKLTEYTAEVSQIIKLEAILEKNKLSYYSLLKSIAIEITRFRDNMIMIEENKSIYEKGLLVNRKVYDSSMILKDMSNNYDINDLQIEEEKFINLMGVAKHTLQDISNNLKEEIDELFKSL